MSYKKDRMMQKISFRIPHVYIGEIHNFLEGQDVDSFSVFECEDMGFSEDLDENGFPVASFFIVEIFNQSIDLLHILKEKFGDITQDIQINEIDNNDWVAQYISELKPVIVDGFYIYNDNFKEVFQENNLLPVKINSALAFGSGDHQTTRACISMLQHLKSGGFTPKDVLDMGCGSGVLAICAAKLWTDLNIKAIDIDTDAVQITKDNFKINEVVGEVFQGCDVSFCCSQQKIDMILCNILKKPLEDLSSSFFEILKPGGLIITSGFIVSQYEEIEKCYIEQGFKNIHQIRIDDWFAVLFKKP